MANKKKKNTAPPGSPPAQEQEAFETLDVPYSDPYSGKQLFSPEEQEAALAYLAIQQKEQKLIDIGWKTITKAAEETGLARDMIRVRVRIIDPEEKHSFTEPLTGNTITKKGAGWVHQSPNSQSAEYFIHPGLAEIWRQEAEKERQLEKQGWKTTAKAAKEKGMARDMIRARLKKINPEEKHSFTEPLTGETIIKKGDKWVYQNPNSKRAEYFIHPDLVEILWQEVEKERLLKEQGWKTIAKVIEETGLEKKPIQARLKKIDLEEKHSFTEPLTGNTITKKGTDWVYQSPNGQTAEYLIHPDLIRILQQEVEKERQLEKQGWKTTAKAAEETGLKRDMIRARLRKINPEEKHSFTEPLTNKTITKEGADWVYQNPNSKSAEYFIHPDLIEILRQEAEKERQLKKQERKTVADVAEETGLEKQKIRARLRKINPEEKHSFTEPLTSKTITKEGADWVYQNPNSKSAEYFIHPDLVRILRQEAEVKAAETTKKGGISKKIGALDEEKSPEVADEAAQKKKGRKKGKE